MRAFGRVLLVDDTDQLLLLCFVLMPFGKKMDAAARVTNFDSVYAKIIAPAVERSGLEPIRADEEKIGGTIHKPMFERLMLCHYAVADITGANPNVFYELGIRHAMRPRSTVIVFAEGTVLPFDIALVRGITYETDARASRSTPKRRSRKSPISSRRRVAIRTTTARSSNWSRAYPAGTWITPRPTSSARRSTTPSATRTVCARR